MVDVWSRLKPEMEARGMGIQQLADALQVSFQAVAKVRDGGSFGLANNIKAAKLFGVSAEWLATGKGSRLAPRHPQNDGGPSLGGDSLSLASKSHQMEEITLPNTATWGEVMQMRVVPDQFTIRMPDGSLGEKIPEGTALIFRRSATAEPRQCVLVEDGSGARYVRRYAQASGGAWLAQALDDSYVTLHSERDSLRVLAVLAWRESSEVV